MATPQITSLALRSDTTVITLTDNVSYAVEFKGLSFKRGRKRQTEVNQRLGIGHLVSSETELLEITLQLWVKKISSGISDGVSGGIAPDGTPFAFYHWRKLANFLEDAERYARDGIGSPCVLEYRYGTAGVVAYYDVLYGDLPAAPNGGEFSGGWIGGGELVLTCQPWGRSPTRLRKDALGLGPAYDYLVPVEGPTISGDLSTPARLELTPPVAGQTYQEVRLATRSRGTPSTFHPVFYSWDTLGAPALIRMFTLTANLWAKNGGTTGVFALDFSPDNGTTWYQCGERIEVTSGSFTNYTRSLPLNPATHLRWNLYDYTMNPARWRIRKIGTDQVFVSRFYVTLALRDSSDIETVETLYPTSTVSNSWTPTGAATAHAALDASDASFIDSSTDGQAAVLGLTIGTGGGVVVRQPTVNWVRNPGFEDSPNLWSSSVGAEILTNGALNGPYTAGIASGWTLNDPLGSLTVAEETVLVHGGSAQKLRRSGTYGDIRQDLTIAPNTRYRVSGWLAVNGAGQTAKFRVFVNNVERVGFSSSSNGTYQYVEGTFVSPAVINAGQSQAILHTDLTVAADALFDDLSIVPIEDIPAEWAKTGSLVTYRVAGQSGPYAVAALGGSSSNYLGQTVSVVPGATYRLRAKVYAQTGAMATLLAVTNGDAASIALTNAGILDVWTTVTGLITVPNNGTQLTIKFYGTSLNGSLPTLVQIDNVELIREDDTVGSLFSRSITSSNYYGDYRVFARLQAVGTPFAVQLVHGTDAEPPVVVNPGSTKLVDLGRMNVPGNEPPPGVTLGAPYFNFGLRQYFTDSYPQVVGSTLYVHSLILMPVDENYIELFLPANAPLTYGKHAVLDLLAPRGPLAYYSSASVGDGNYIARMPSGAGRIMLPRGTSYVIALVSRSADEHRVGDTLDSYWLYHERYQWLK